MGVLLSEKHGLNPTMALCSQCGKETGEILLLGKCNKYKCVDCGATTYGRLIGKEKKCPQCNGLQIDMVATDVKAPTHLKSGGVCGECKTTNEKYAALVRQGGIYWRCLTCGSAGVIRPGTEFALMVRHKTQIVAPNPVGMDFTPEECPVCQAKMEGNDGPKA